MDPDSLSKQNQIKSITENKENIENKLKKLDANLAILEQNQSPNNLTLISKNDSTIIKELPDDNLRKDRIKEIKTSKVNLESKLQLLDGQIKILIKEEEINNNRKNISIKSYLDNFQKDKLESEQKVKKWDNDRKELEKKQKIDLDRSFEINKKKMAKIEAEVHKKEEHKKEENKKYINGLHERAIRVSKEIVEIQR